MSAGLQILSLQLDENASKGILRCKLSGRITDPVHFDSRLGHSISKLRNISTLRYFIPKKGKWDFRWIVYEWFKNRPSIQFIMFFKCGSAT